MENSFQAIAYPELVFGIAGAIGIDIEEINRALTEALSAVSYRAIPIRITTEIEREQTDIPVPLASDFGSQISYKMSHASAVCRKYKAPDTLMRFAIRAIRNHRAREAEAEFQTEFQKSDKNEPAPEERVIPRQAYIIR